MPKKTKTETAPYIVFIALGMGYVESGRVASLLLRHQGEEAHTSSRQALHEIAVLLFRKYLYDTEYQRGLRLIKQCCKDSLEKAGAEDYFCTKCSHRIKPQGVDFEEFQSWIYDLPGRNADEWGEELEVWWPWDTISDVLKQPQGSFFEVFEQAEALLVSLLEEEDVEPEHRPTLLMWQQENRMADEYIARHLTGKEPR